MNNSHLSETKQTEQQTEKHSRRDSQENEGFGDGSLHPMLQLQQAIGNRAVGQMLRSDQALPIQRRTAPNSDTGSEMAHGPETSPSQNNTGLPDNLKANLENMSGMSMDDVNVHYNSPEPSQIDALAYTKGSDIHVGPGQKRHLPHEAWHVVQQKQGRVTPTMQLKGEQINDDSTFEREADVMGAKADHEPSNEPQLSATERKPVSPETGVIQGKFVDEDLIQARRYIWNHLKKYERNVDLDDRVVVAIYEMEDSKVNWIIDPGHSRRDFNRILEGLMAMFDDGYLDSFIEQNREGKMDRKFTDLKPQVHPLLAKSGLPTAKSLIVPELESKSKEKQEKKSEEPVIIPVESLEENTKKQKQKEAEPENEFPENLEFDDEDSEQEDNENDNELDKLSKSSDLDKFKEGRSLSKGSDFLKENKKKAVEDEDSKKMAAGVEEAHALPYNSTNLAFEAVLHIASAIAICAAGSALGLTMVGIPPGFAWVLAAIFQGTIGISKIIRSVLAFRAKAKKKKKEKNDPSAQEINAWPKFNAFLVALEAACWGAFNILTLAMNPLKWLGIFGAGLKLIRGGIMFCAKCRPPKTERGKKALEYTLAGFKIVENALSLLENIISKVVAIAAQKSFKLAVKVILPLLGACRNAAKGFRTVKGKNEAPISKDTNKKWYQGWSLRKKSTK